MILNRQRRVPVPVAPLAEFLERAQRELRFPENGVTVQLLSDPAMARLNRTFRGKNTPTDVLAFPADEPQRVAPRKPSGNQRRRSPSPAGQYFGDIAISPETARRNARRLSREFLAELRILILHGMIHLAGYDHETDEGQMERLERRLRRRLRLDA